MARLITIEDRHSCPVDGDGVPLVDPGSPATWVPASTRAVREGDLTMPDHRSVDGDRIDAYINHGRWVVDCPCCPSAQLVSPDDPKFWCPDCGSNGVWWKVKFPRHLDAIEDVLLRRPVDNRHWLPGETTADLEAENTAHEVP